MPRKIILLLFSIIFLVPAIPAFSPADEVPTDSSIWVSIDDASFSIDRSGEMARITIGAEGRASPNVHHCGIVFLTVYKNGSTNYNGNFIMGPLNITGKEPLVFMPINGTWQKWKFYHVAYVEKEKIGINESDLGNISSFEIWVRAYGDEENTKWNQSYIEITETVKEKMEDFYTHEEKEGFKINMPLILFVVSLIIVIALLYVKWRK